MEQILRYKVTCMAICEAEKELIFTTENFQLMKVMIELDKPSEDGKYEFLICPFHSRPVQGMDICIKKNLIATCSVDKTVRVWNNQVNATTPSLEIC